MSRWKPLAVPPATDLTGMRFDRWLVVRLHEQKGWHKVWWCRCDCGCEKAVYGISLRKGDSRSCGCLQRETVIRTATSHGRSRSREYAIWQGILARCYRAGAAGFHNYGGRGIRVCVRWRHSFEAFFARMGEAPTARHTIDRKDGNGDYEPSNCEWSTRKEQAQHRQNSQFITHDGLTLNVTQWAEKTGMNPSTLLHRLRAGWPHARVVTEPVRDWGR